MKDFSPHESAEKQPRVVDLFGAEMEAELKNAGQLYQRKMESITIRGAEQATKSQSVETHLPDGTIESSFEAEPGDWIITGAKGERFVFNSKKFDSLYKPDSKGGYIPKDCRVIALKNPFGEAVRIFAPWGTPEKPAYQDGSEKCFFVISLDEAGNYTNNRYIIGDEELLLSNYDRIYSQEIQTEVEGIISSLSQRGWDFVYINLSTGKYGAEKNLSDFPFGYRKDCYCLNPEKYPNNFLKTKDDLMKNMSQCLSEGIQLQDIKNLIEKVE